MSAVNAPVDRGHSQDPHLLDRLLGKLIRERLAREVTSEYDGATTGGIPPFGRPFLAWLRDANRVGHRS